MISLRQLLVGVVVVIVVVVVVVVNVVVVVVIIVVVFVVFFFCCCGFVVVVVLFCFKASRDEQLLYIHRFWIRHPKRTGLSYLKRHCGN